MFYAGAGFVTKGHSYRTYDWDGAAALFGRMMNSYSLQDSLDKSGGDKSGGK
jgi:4-hydroxyphenylacetate 3-monooxygenase